MDPATKKQALGKVAGMSLKVGYPDHPQDYSGLEITRGDAYGNARRAAAFGFQQDLAKIGQPVDKKEWGMSAPSVNAYYDNQNNEIVFPAGILQPPFFDPKGGPSINFGAIGAVVGHEMTHGFDDEGHQFDSGGNLHDWWTDKDSQSYNERAQSFVKQYSGYQQIPGQKGSVNGELTLGENIADNGGLRLAYKAFQNTPGEKRGSDGFSPEQSFFLSFGRVWCGNETPEFARLSAATDPHPPSRVRVNGTVSNMPEFQQAFNCKPDSAMVRSQPSRIW
jgi:predicted metalloendopeptidase